MTSNVKALPGSRVPGDRTVNTALVEALRLLLGRAESGELQSFIGTGFQADNLRASLWCDHHKDLYAMLGSLAWLQAEYVHRHTEGLK
ncbi:MAG: hypothetical protein NUV75_01320 [Gallionella sp.]|nr:hypothetical protein [Gallionella sp.]